MSRQVHRRVDALEGAVRKMAKEVETTAARGKEMAKAVARVGIVLADLLERDDEETRERAFELLEDLGFFQRTEDGEGIFLRDKISEVQRAFELTTSKDPPAMPIERP